MPSGIYQHKKGFKFNEQLRNDGWLVLRYWEHEINANVEDCVDEIEDIILTRGII